MMLNRAQNYSAYIVDGEVIFSGTDPWYHYRSTMYVVQNWPATMPFDPWTNFPYGTRSGQFGTLMDQVFGTIALIVGLGDPSAETVGMVVLFAPVVMGALAAIPLYVLARRLAGRIGGVTAIAILALSSGLFLQRSIVGVYDHQVAEALLQVTSVLAVMVALSVAERDKPVYEQFLEPLLDAKFGERKDDVSAAWFLGRVKFRGERDLLRGEVLGYVDGGFGRLLDALVEAVGREHVETGTRVTDVGIADGRVESVTLDDGEERVEESDGVVVAAMPNVLESLTGYECDVDFQGALCAVVTMEESLTDTYWLNVAHDAPFGALIEHTNFVSPERYGGDHLLYVASYVQSLDDPLWQASDDEVRETWLSEVGSMFPDFDRGSVSEFRLARAPRAAPVYERGYLDLVVPYDLATEVAEGVYYAGMASPAQYPERSLDGGVVAGYECADRIAARASGSETGARASPRPGD